MTLKERYDGVLRHFAKTQPNPTTELHSNSPFETLVAVILSAQCTDKRVNMVTPALFEALPTPHAMAQCTTAEIMQYIKSVTFPNNKARHLRDMAVMLVERYDGQVPDSLDALMRLPGVGRKTANVVMGVVWGKAAIAVDTHVFRVARRIGLADGTTPLAVEQKLTANIPVNQRYKAHHWLLLHGRYVCKARKPQCDECAISQWCATRERESLEARRD